MFGSGPCLSIKLSAIIESGLIQCSGLNTKRSPDCGLSGAFEHVEMIGCVLRVTTRVVCCREDVASYADPEGAKDLTTNEVSAGGFFGTRIFMLPYVRRFRRGAVTNTCRIFRFDRPRHFLVVYAIT